MDEARLIEKMLLIEALIAGADPTSQPADATPGGQANPGRIATPPGDGDGEGGAKRQGKRNRKEKKRKKRKRR